MVCTKTGNTLLCLIPRIECSMSMKSYSKKRFNIALPLESNILNSLLKTTILTIESRLETLEYFSLKPHYYIPGNPS